MLYYPKLAEDAFYTTDLLQHSFKMNSAEFSDQISDQNSKHFRFQNFHFFRLVFDRARLLSHKVLIFSNRPKMKIFYRDAVTNAVTSVALGLTPLSKNEAGNSGILSGSGAEVMSGSEEGKF